MLQSSLPVKAAMGDIDTFSKNFSLIDPGFDGYVLPYFWNHDRRLSEAIPHFDIRNSLIDIRYSFHFIK
jgi:hypothetical protein